MNDSGYRRDCKNHKSEAHRVGFDRVDVLVIAAVSFPIRHRHRLLG